MKFEIKKDDTNSYKKLIIKYDDKITSTYSLNTYNEYPFLKNIVSKNKFTEILDKANILIYSAKMKKAKFDKVEISKITYVLIFISFVFTIIYIFLFYYILRVNKDTKIMKTIGIIFFILSLIILIGIEIFFMTQKVQGDKTLYYFYKKDMKLYIEELNKKWKNVMFFKFDKINKNIICYVKVNRDNDEDDNINDSENIINTKDTK
jgi:hypothetical protein